MLEFFVLFIFLKRLCITASEAHMGQAVIMMWCVLGCECVAIAGNVQINPQKP